MKILLHTCCGPCATYPVKRLLSGNHEVNCFFYNPNIHGYREYIKRLKAVIEVCRHFNIALTVCEIYEIEAWFRMVIGDFRDRCGRCYKDRIERAALKAVEIGCDSFTSTLLISHKQDHEKIKNICEEAAKNNNIEFYYEDFRKGWKEHWQMTDDLDLYKQNYCGCLFSEYERFNNRKDRKKNE